jgi:hypothetical protein
MPLAACLLCSDRRCRQKAKGSMQVQAEADARIARAEKRAKDAEYLVKHLEREIAALKETNQYAWREGGQVDPLKPPSHWNIGVHCPPGTTHLLFRCASTCTIDVQPSADKPLL